MCTLILGIDVVAPGTVLLGANRDEDPARPSDPPGVLRPSPRLVGGRDRVARGTWLAVRGREGVVAMLNRREDVTEPPSPPRASRGQLALEIAALAAPDPARALEVAGRHEYAPFSCVYASPDACWMVWRSAQQSPWASLIAPGWHVLTHAELDDPNEPKAAAVRRRLATAHAGPDGVGRRWTRDEAEALVRTCLASHGDAESPAVCLHEGRMQTVSSSLVWLAPDEVRYLHSEGRPCEHPFADFTHLLTDDASGTSH